MHAARSFLSFLAQIGFPSAGAPDATAFALNFRAKDADGNTHVLSVPALALVPVQPLTVQTADIEFSFQVEAVGDHQQEQSSRGGTAPRQWFLVETPASFRGTVSEQSAEKSSITVKLHLERAPVPAALAKLLTSLSEFTVVVAPPSTLPSVPQPPSPIGSSNAN